MKELVEILAGHLYGTPAPAREDSVACVLILEHVARP